jgi:hypothetical protein
MTMDAEWLDLLLHLRVYLSPLQWTPYDWGAVVVQSVSIAIATDLLSGPARRVFAASFMVALGGLLAAILLGDMFVSLLAIQMQFWRTIWLLAALAPFAFALCVLRLGVEAARGWPGRVTLAALAFGWFSNPDIVVAVAVAVLALIAHFGIWTKKTPTKYLIALGAAMTGLTLFYTHTLIDFWHFLEKFPPVPALALYAMFRFSIAALPICLVAVMWVWAKPQLRAALGSFCTREDAPVAIIFPLEKNKPLPAGLDAAIWTPPHSRYIADANDKMIWHVIDRYAGVPCRDKAESKKPRGDPMPPVLRGGLL